MKIKMHVQKQQRGDKTQPVTLRGIKSQLKGSAHWQARQHQRNTNNRGRRGAK